MKYYFRLLLLLLCSPFRTAVPLIGPCITKFRVWPNDLDVFMHMNNGAYLTIMDLARTDLIIRSGILKPVMKNHWYPVVAGETIRFKRSLKLFQRYEIETEVACWDDRSFYLVQQFTSGGHFVAKAVVEARFLSTSGHKVTAQEFIDAIGHTEPSPPMPEWIADWQRAQATMNNSDKVTE